jgi:hypothetical protein
MTDQNPNIEDYLWEHFKQKILVIMNEFIPTTMINNSKRKLPWINKEIKSLIRKRNKRMNQHKNNTQYKDTKQRLQKETRRAYWNYPENIICYDENSELVQKQKIFWNYRRNTKKDSSGVAPLRQEGMLIDDTRQKAEILSKQYHSVSTPECENEELPSLNRSAETIINDGFS